MEWKSHRQFPWPQSYQRQKLGFRNLKYYWLWKQHYWRKNWTFAKTVGIVVNSLILVHSFENTYGSPIDFILCTVSTQIRFSQRDNTVLTDIFD